jgi:CheY-like chemotaxis protein
MARYASAEPRPLHLLVVEDEGLIAMDLVAQLTEIGHDVVGVASSVGRALAMIGRLKNDIDCAIVDANLGGESAVPVAEALRCEEIPFVLASGYSTSELQRLGFTEVTIRKPYNRNVLDRALAGSCGTS